MTELQRLAEEYSRTYTSAELDALKHMALAAALEAHEEQQEEVERRFLAKAELYNAALHWQGVSNEKV